MSWRWRHGSHGHRHGHDWDHWQDWRWDWDHWHDWRDWDSDWHDWDWEGWGGRGKGHKGHKGPKGHKGHRHCDGRDLAKYASDDLSTLGVLGSGVSGLTFRGSFQNIPVAVKTWANHVELECLRRIASTSMEGVVPVLAVDHDTPEGPVQILKLASHGTLTAALSRGFGKASFVAMIESLALGLAELHSAGILHCDVKPDNVVLHSTRPGSAQLWLIDFGDARLVDEPSSWKTQRPGDPSVTCLADLRSGAFSPATDAWCLAQAAAWIWQGWEPWNPAHLDDAMPLQQILY
ncbi:dapk-1, partial [Symbiodinium sp. CCMP2456]